MSIFCDESENPRAVVWNTADPFQTNLKQFKSLFYDLIMRDKLVEDKAEFADVAKDFIGSLGALVDQYEAKIQELRGERFYALPKKLSVADFVAHCVAIFKDNNYDISNTLSGLDITEQNLFSYGGLLEYMRNFNFPVDLTVRVDFENFYAKRIIETEVGTFLLAYAYVDWEHPVYFFMYFSDEDPDTFFTYVPKNGNYWDFETRRAFENQGFPRSERAYDKKAMLDELLEFFAKQLDEVII